MMRKYSFTVLVPTVITVLAVASSRAQATDQSAITGGGSGKQKHTTAFVQGKEFASPQLHAIALHLPFADQDTHWLNFYDRTGLLTNRIKRKDDAGLERKLLFRQDGTPSNIVLKSSRGFEWASDNFEFYSSNGKKLMEISDPASTNALSPTGNVLILAHSNPSLQYGFTPSFSLFSSSGTKLAEIQIPFSPASPTFSFSREGDIGAILFENRLRNTTQGGVLIFSSTGEVLGTFQAQGFMPALGLPDNSGHKALAPLAEIDQTNGIAIVAGRESLKGRLVIAIDFKGHQVWRWDVPTAEQDCPSALIVNPVPRKVVFADFCNGEIFLHELSEETGRQIKGQRIEIDEGRPTDVSTSSSPDGAQILINITPDPSTRFKPAILLIGPDMNLRWQEISTLENASSARFDSAGNAVLKRGNHLYVGKFKE